jgi:N-acetylneuraminic acid mutarotase
LRDLVFVFEGLLLLVLVIISEMSTLSYSSTLLTWSYGESMPTKRSEVSGTVLDNKIYIIGGSDEKGPTDLVDVYDPEINNWAIVSPLPKKLDHTAAATYDGKIYIVGGFDSNGMPSDSLFIYDPITDKWEIGKNMPTARGGLTSKFVNGTLYVIGGDATALYDSKGNYNPQGVVATNEAYTPKNDSWTTKSPMPTSRDHLTSAVISGNIFVLGGRQPEKGPLFKDLSTNEMYDTSNDRWISLEPLPTNRSGLAATSVNGSIYVFGGESTEKTFDNNEKYDPKSQSWTAESPMLTPRHGLAAAAINDKIYVIAGGPKPGGSGDDANEIFHIG